jgi:hypothetical protein
VIVGCESLKAYAFGAHRILQQALESPGLPVQSYER